MNGLFDEEFLGFLAQQSILLVGVGGIGCELLKVLCKFPLKLIHIVDLDTIEVSNLNRQFLFRQSHVGQSKAHVARNVIKDLAPSLNVISHEANIKSSEFTLDFFNQFDIFIMALDNEEARSYLNQIGMLLDIPLVEAGTTGYKGQGMLFKKEVSRCYDCFPREKSKVYQVCTIRTTPEKPIHCIVWAKFLFELCFGVENQENYLSDLAAMLKDQAKSGQEIAGEVFSKQVAQQRDLEQKFAHLKPVDVKTELEKEKGRSAEEITDEADRASKIQSLSFYVRDFCDSFDILRSIKGAGLKYDKDNEMSVKFVTASANLRAHNFGIPLQSEFVVRDQSGNIIPAIASTNSIVAAIQVNEMVKFFLKKHAFLAKASQFLNVSLQNKEVYVNNVNSKRLHSNNMLRPNPLCYSCRGDLTTLIYYLHPDSQFGSAIDRLRPFIQEKQGKKELNYTVMTHDKNILFEEEPMLDEEDEARYRKIAAKTMREISKGMKQIRLLVDLGASQFFNSVLILNEKVALGEIQDFLHRKNEAFDQFLKETQSAKPEKKKKCQTLFEAGKILGNNKGNLKDAFLFLDSDEEKDSPKKKKEMLIELEDKEGMESIEEHKKNGGDPQAMQAKRIKNAMPENKELIDLD